MPALNEEHHITDAIASVMPDTNEVLFEILVLDGGSRDGTQRIVSELATREPRIRLINNPRRIQSAALNIAARACDSRTTIIVRADCHATYPRDFVQRCVETLARTGCASVVVPMRAVGRGGVQRAIAAAQNSRLGNGGSPHRMGGKSGEVDHGHHAAFDRAAFLAVGGYDETAPYNEDAEFDARLTASGLRIFLNADLTIDYFPRPTFRSLALQYFRHGWGRANTLLKHRLLPKPRQILPVIVLAGCVAGFAFYPLIGAYALLPPATYAAACLIWGAFLAKDRRDLAVLGSGVAAITMHMSWATGFVARAAEAAGRATLVACRNVKDRLRSVSRLPR